MGSGPSGLGLRVQGLILSGIGARLLRELGLGAESWSLESLGHRVGNLKL